MRRRGIDSAARRGRATFVDAADLDWMIVSVRVLSVRGILAFVLTYRLFRRLEADLLALARATPQRKR
ncbi:hypothetical protein [Nocardia sp. NPDC049707]|uniref:hypothetical protein n=1 Tax=Nocardia sp. NPDC049707 TaxID=3154735 RepID=UPI00341D159C